MRFPTWSLFIYDLWLNWMLADLRTWPKEKGRLTLTPPKLPLYSLLASNTVESLYLRSRQVLPESDWPNTYVTAENIPLELNQASSSMNHAARGQDHQNGFLGQALRRFYFWCQRRHIYKRKDIRRWAVSGLGGASVPSLPSIRVTNPEETKARETLSKSSRAKRSSSDTPWWIGSESNGSFASLSVLPGITLLI